MESILPPHEWESWLRHRSPQDETCTAASCPTYAQEGQVLPPPGQQWHGGGGSLIGIARRRSSLLPALSRQWAAAALGGGLRGGDLASSGGRDLARAFALGGTGTSLIRKTARLIISHENVCIKTALIPNAFIRSLKVWAEPVAFVLTRRWGAVLSTLGPR